MSELKRLTRTSLVSLALTLGVSVSTFAEERTLLTTVERIRAAGSILEARNRSGARRDAPIAVTLRQLEQLLRNRSRRAAAGPRRGEATARPRSRRERSHGGPPVMPVAGVSAHELRDSFGDSRTGGRSHAGIDIFAPRWTEVLAATDGVVTSIGNGARSGRSFWLVSRDGRAYFYAHLEDWAEGLRENRSVSAGQVLGYVGNSGNAAGGPTHLHFEIRDEYRRAINPYPVLADAAPGDGYPVAGR